MNFTKDSQIVKSYLLLINEELRTIEDVPPLFNLKEAVQSALDEQEQEVAQEETETTEE